MLDILAGPKAARHIRERGFRAEDVDVLAGASGGPKWLVLAGLDRVLFARLRDASRSRPLHCIGSSIGSWRIACLAQRDPVAAVDRFEEAYIEQRYAPAPTVDDVSAVGESILAALLGDHGVAEILDHRWLRMHVLTTLCRGALATESRGALLAGLGLAAAGNLAWRGTLRLQMRRAIFDTAGHDSPFRGLTDLPTVHQPLTRENAKAALMASAAIPLVMRGVRIPGAAPGVYRDGGVLDYHPDLDFGSGDGIVLYPHFYSHITPGWFDKSLPWRRSRGSNLDRALIIAPSDEFVRSLPGGRIPDRSDFYRMHDSDRIRAWRSVTAASRRLGEELAELLANGRWSERIRPMSGESPVA